MGAPTGSTYYAKVPNEVTSISIYANGATSGTGTKTLKEGTNKFTVSNGTYTYYINVTRATLDGEEPANKPDDEERDEDIDTVIGLKSLSIEGYEFDKEFKSDVFEYKVKVEEALTQIQLDQIKELVKAEVNAENVEYEVVAELAEDGVATITIIVKDAEKEYSKYVITFEVEEEESEEIIGAVLPMPNKSNPTRGMFGLTEEQQIYAILGVFGITFLIALIYAVVSYVQHRKLLEYTEEDEEDNFEDYLGLALLDTTAKPVGHANYSFGQVFLGLGFAFLAIGLLLLIFNHPHNNIQSIVKKVGIDLGLERQKLGLPQKLVHADIFQFLLVQSGLHLGFLVQVLNQMPDILLHPTEDRHSGHRT